MKKPLTVGQRIRKGERVSELIIATGVWVAVGLIIFVARVINILGVIRYG